MIYYRTSTIFELHTICVVSELKVLQLINILMILLHTPSINGRKGLEYFELKLNSIFSRISAFRQ